MYKQNIIKKWMKGYILSVARERSTSEFEANASVSHVQGASKKKQGHF